MTEKLKAPFPYFGGKSRLADRLWKRLGDVDNYIEPFCGSAAVLLLRPSAPQVETINDINCVAPDTLILKSDLTWGRAGAVQVGDKLIGFDEFNKGKQSGFSAPKQYRRWQIGTVLAVRRLKKPCYRLTFEDGTTIICSADHQWLSGSHAKEGKGRAWRWLKTKSLRCDRGKQRSWVCKLTDVVHQEESFDAGWIGGFFDGEGSLKPTPGWEVNAAQKEGPEADRAEELLKSRGFQVRRSVVHKDEPNHAQIVHLCVTGGMRSTLCFLMQFRPERLLRKLDKTWSERSVYGREKQAIGLVKKEFLGEQEVVAIQTDCRTFVAEGLASHNCYVANFWRATQEAPERVVEYCDWPVNETDLRARHHWLVLSDAAAKFRKQIKTDPDYCNAKIAGWWCWGACQWIGSGWCMEPTETEQDAGEIQHGNRNCGNPARTKMKLNKTPEGRPQLADAYDIGRGVCGTPSEKRPAILDAMTSVTTGPRGACAERRAWLLDWFGRLRDRLRNVRILCGDWIRTCGSPSVTTRLGTTGIFFDPPYRIHQKEGKKKSRSKELYSTDDAQKVNKLNDDLIAYCKERGDDRKMRLVVTTYEGDGYEELMKHGWQMESWEAGGGYANRGKKTKSSMSDNAKRERIFYSPHCLFEQEGFF